MASIAGFRILVSGVIFVATMPAGANAEPRTPAIESAVRQPADAATKSRDDEMTVLSFPKDRSLGTVSSYIPFDEVEDVQSLDARGDVRLKSGKNRPIVLFITQAASKDLSPLSGLARQGLTHLSFYAVRVSDEMLNQLAAIPELRGLALHNTGLTAADIPKLTRFKSLTALGVDMPLSDQQLEALTRLENLEEFGFGQTRLTPAAWSSLVKFKALRSLRLGETLATVDGLSHLRQLPALERLVINTSGEISTTAVSKIAAHTKLKRLGLYGTIDGAALDVIGRMSQLEGLTLQPLKAPNDAINHLSGLKSLKHLSAPVNSNAIAEIEQFKSLRSLSIGTFQSLDGGLKHLAPLGILERLSLTGIGITDDGLAQLAPLKSLATLAITGRNVTDEGLRHLAQLPALDNLTIQNFTVTGPRLRHVGSLARLKSLTIGRASKNGPRLSDADFSDLADLQSLVELRLSHLPVGDAGVRHIARLNTLETLLLNPSDMLLSDQALDYLASMTKLRVVMLSGRFTDTGLDALMKCPSLNALTIRSPTLTENDLAKLRTKMTVVDWQKMRAAASTPSDE